MLKTLLEVQLNVESANSQWDGKFEPRGEIVLGGAAVGEEFSPLFWFSNP